jgi:hypothetical protein
MTKNERLAKKIQAYWAERGYLVKISASPEGLSSATVNGAPVAKPVLCPSVQKKGGKKNGR